MTDQVFQVGQTFRYGEGTGVLDVPFDAVFEDEFGVKWWRTMVGWDSEPSPALFMPGELTIVSL